ncbi:hypothetical protein AB0A77_26225 [Streptomyces varsoviensis]|uniref:hypothetical protein n=1 Tax=Streptomyces varsoviensis TaxID=67373 RepID=UPI0033F100E5
MARTESGNRGKRAVGGATAIALLAAAPLLAACSNASNTSDSSAKSASASASASASRSGGPSAPPAGQSHHPGGSTGGGTGSGYDGPGAAGRSTPSGAVAAWVGAVIQKDVKKACLVSVMPGEGSGPGQPATPQKCDDPATTKGLAAGLNAMSKSFTPPNATGNPVVSVQVSHPKGDKVMVPSGKIMVNGKPLREIMLSLSTGVDPKTFSAKVEADKINGRWYVGDFDLDAGSGGQHHPQGR